MNNKDNIIDITFDNIDSKNKQIQISNIDISIKNLQKRIILHKNFQKEICNWILFEINKYIQTNHSNTNIFHVEDIPSLFNFIIISLQPIFKKITEWYNLDSKIKLDILDIYFFDASKEIKENIMDNENLVIKILLQNECNILFEDRLISKLTMGDGIVYKSNITSKIINNPPENTYFLVAKIGIINTF